MTRIRDRRQYDYVLNLAKEFYGLEGKFTDEDVSGIFNDYSAKYHPDVSDLPHDEAQDLFDATTTARDALRGNIGRSNSRELRNAVSKLEGVLDDDKVESAREATIEGASGSGYGVSATAGPSRRSEPQDINIEDVGGMKGEEREELMKEISLGYSVMLRFNAVQGLLKKGATQDDFYGLVNDYIDKEGEERLSNRQYYRATSSIVRDDVKVGMYVDAIETVEESLSKEYGSEANIDTIADIIANLVVRGHIEIGSDVFSASYSNFRRPSETRFRKEGRSNFRRAGGEGSKFRRG